MTEPRKWTKPVSRLNRGRQEDQLIEHPALTEFKQEISQQRIELETKRKNQMASYDSKTLKKPGYMGRAIFVWALLNFITFGSLYAIVWVLGNYLPDLLRLWYVLGPLVFAAAATEYSIAIYTIVPVARQWIHQEETVKEGEKASWDKTPVPLSGAGKD